MRVAEDQASRQRARIQSLGEELDILDADDSKTSRSRTTSSGSGTGTPS
jgi:hypothetical protein